MKTGLLGNGKNKSVSTLSARNYLVFHRISRNGLLLRCFRGPCTQIFCGSKELTPEEIPKASWQRNATFCGKRGCHQKKRRKLLLLYLFPPPIATAQRGHSRLFGEFSLIPRRLWAGASAPLLLCESSTFFCQTIHEKG